MAIEEVDDDELGTAAYLRDLADRIMHIPTMYGVDTYDIDRLGRIAAHVEAGDQA